jgi:hypothetical protein
MLRRLYDIYVCFHKKKFDAFHMYTCWRQLLTGIISACRNLAWRKSVGAVEIGGEKKKSGGCWGGGGGGGGGSWGGGGRGGVVGQRREKRVEFPRNVRERWARRSGKNGRVIRACPLFLFLPYRYLARPTGLLGVV